MAKKRVVKRIFLDVDGVLSNFVKAALVALDKEGLLGEKSVEELLAEHSEHDIYNLVGLHPEDIFAVIDKEGVKFWADMEKMPWFDGLVALVKKTAPFTLLTATTRNWTCPAGKLQWIQKHFGGEHFRDYALAPRKWNLATQYGLLIDDNEENVSKWVRNGGCGILFPRPYNKARKYVGKEIEYVKDELSKYSFKKRTKR